MYHVSLAGDNLERNRTKSWETSLPQQESHNTGTFWDAATAVGISTKFANYAVPCITSHSYLFWVLGQIFVEFMVNMTVGVCVGQEEGDVDGDEGCILWQINYFCKLP